MGCQRSGTSALWNALSKHPNLNQNGPSYDGRPNSTIKELWFLREYFLGKKNNVPRKHDGTQIDLEFKCEFAKLVDSFCKKKYAPGHGRWISAHPSDTLDIDDILEMFPSARVLFITRHPQEVVWSSAHAPWIKNMRQREFYAYVAKSAQYWRKFADLAIKYSDINDERVLILRHEQLLKNTTKTAREILYHLNEEYNGRVSGELSKVVNSSFVKNMSSITKLYKTIELIKRDKRFCKTIVSTVGDVMETLSYVDYSDRFNPPGKHFDLDKNKKMISNLITYYDLSKGLKRYLARPHSFHKLFKLFNF